MPPASQVIHLMSSKLSLLVLGNEALVLTLMFGQLCKRLFFGRLRDAEVEGSISHDGRGNARRRHLAQPLR